jgi:hypothetical protein
VYAVKVCSSHPHCARTTHADRLDCQANYNRLLDVARETYKENVGDIFALSHALSQEQDLPFTLVYQEGGFVFTLKKADLEGELPRGFVNVTARKGKWVFSSIELVNYTHERAIES